MVAPSPLLLPATAAVPGARAAVCAARARRSHAVRGTKVASHLMRRQYRIVTEYSGVGVLDKAVSILGFLSEGPASLAELVAATGLARPTTHRIARALETHRLVA